MTTWTFDSDTDGWTLNDDAGCNTAQWTNSEYHDNPGAIEFISGDSACGGMGMTENISPAESGHSDFSFYYKYDNQTGGDVELYWTVYYDDATSTTDSVTLSDGVTSGWLQMSTSSINSAKNADQITIEVLDGYTFEELWFWIDDVDFPAGADDLRYLGMTSDQENIYLTAVQGGTQQFIYYDQSTLTAQGTSSFGAVDYADPDTLTAGLWPVAKPGADNVIYVYGRDGNDVQIHYNDLNGTLGWQDIGPGTATWGTAKFMAAAMIDPLVADDLVVAFSDDDVYTTPEGTANWVKLGDITEGVRAAARHPVRDNEILFAGTAAGSAYWSPNFGVSDTAAGGTVMGTIHWIEVSR